MTDFSVRLLAQKAVELGFVTSISPNTIHEMLKKTLNGKESLTAGVA